MMRRDRHLPCVREMPVLCQAQTGGFTDSHCVDVYWSFFASVYVAHPISLTAARCADAQTASKTASTMIYRDSGDDLAPILPADGLLDILE